MERLQQEKISDSEQESIKRGDIDPLIAQDHEERYNLTNELHARPFMRLSAPAKVSFYAMTSGEGKGVEDHAHIQVLCERMGVNPPAACASHFSADFGSFRLRWERHSEFSTYSFLVEGDFDEPFEKMPVERVPRDWLQTLPGKRIVGVSLAFLGQEAAGVIDEEMMRQWMARGCLVTSQVASCEAQIWTDFQIHGDGHSRILIQNNHLNGWKAGRVLQRILEVITYSNMALLALPIAQKVGQEMVQIDKELADLTLRVAQEEAKQGLSPNQDAEALSQLTNLSADIEGLTSASIYRLSAARAYYALVLDRLKELNEERVIGFQQVGEFLDRRLAPAMRTCDSTDERLGALSRRATRVANLLRTRVDFVVEAQNQKLLSSMARRSKLQLRLQETVEGLSIAAITYYTVGLVGYASKALKSFGLPIDVVIFQGISVPIIAIFLWMSVHKIKSNIKYDKKS